MALIQNLSLEASNWINVGLGILDLVLGADPLGLVMALVGGVGKWEIQKQRGYDNEKPDKYRGRKVGRVYVNGKWRTAIVKNLLSSTSWGSRDKILEMEVGDNLRFVFGGDGHLEPVFDNPITKRFEIRDEEFDDNYYSTKDFLEKFDPLRGWYFYSKEEQTDLFQGLGDQTATFEDEDIDTTDMTPWLRDMEGWRRVLDLQQDVKWQPIATESGEKLDFYQPDASFKALYNYGDAHGRRVTMPGTTNSYWASGFFFNTPYYREFYEEQEETNKKGSQPHYISNQPTSIPQDIGAYARTKMTDDELHEAYQTQDFSENFENDFLLKHMWNDSFKALVYTQRRAAESVGGIEL